MQNINIFQGIKTFFWGEFDHEVSFVHTFEFSVHRSLDRIQLNSNSANSANTCHVGSSIMSHVSDQNIQVLTSLGTSLIDAIFHLQPLQNIKDLVQAGAPLWYQDDHEGLSPLHAAAFVENPELVRFLIDQGAVWNSGDSGLQICLLVHFWPGFSRPLAEYGRRCCSLAKQRRMLHDYTWCRYTLRLGYIHRCDVPNSKY